LWAINLLIRISFGIKPVRGGMPARERNNTPRIINHDGDMEVKEGILAPDWAIMGNIRNRGATTKQYKVKYIMHRVGFRITRGASIQPMWVIDE
jgi:hypothetical protein